MLIKTKPLPAPKELRSQIPLSAEQKTFVASTRQEIRDIFDGKDLRMLLIMGPCSIHDPIAAKKYAMHLKELSQQVSDQFLVIMRVYFEKPRTILGWKGMLYDPELDGSHNIEEGMFRTRKLLSELANLEIPTAAELLDPSSASYFGDLLSWGCIGARTVSSQIHRQMASGLPMPVAFKNSTDGNIAHAVNGVSAASVPHTYLGVDDDGRIASFSTEGNRYCHVVLRGGEEKPNYDPQSVTRAQSLLREAELPEHLIIDCSHDNCVGVHEHQRVVFHSAINQRVLGNKAIRGIVLESNLMDGQQCISSAELKFGVSITDPCVDWSVTEQLVRWGSIKLASVNEEMQSKPETSDTLCVVD